MILVSTDGSELSDKAIRSAATLAKNLKTSILGVTVVKTKGSDTARENLSRVSELAEEVGVPCRTEEITGSTVPDAILNCAKENDVRFIVMASRGLGTLGSLFIGSATQQVLAKADRPVLVIR